MINIFTYIDYRKLLKDLYDERKAQYAHFSYRYIAQKVGFTSAGFFANILQGKRNISPEFIFKFADLFKFKKRETEYFELLVLFNQAKNQEQKKYYFEKILGCKQSRISVTDAQHYEFYSAWYHTVIRELVDIMKVTDNYEEVAARVYPAIKPAEVKRSLELLSAMGFIRKDAEGFYERTERLITTGYEARDVSISNFLMSTADLARRAVDHCPREKRSMSAVTVSVSEETYKAIEERLKMFRREIMEMVHTDKNPDRVYHFNFHVFPMSKV